MAARSHLRAKRSGRLFLARQTTRGECFQLPLQTTWSWQGRQADIGELRTQLEEEWKTKLEEEKRKHNLELEKLKREVRTGQFKRETLKGEIKMGKEWQERLKKYGKRMDGMRKEECERGAEMRTELEKKASELQKHQDKETELQNEL